MSPPLILYVDDERANRIVFEQALTEFQVVVAESGVAALAILEAREVAVLVTDMRMPGMTGEELLRVVKERFPTVIRMVVTAYADVDPILRAINEGLVARYIIKPWHRPELVQVLRWACEAWAFGRDSSALQQRLLETERLITLGSIAGMLVHDLKQPLVSLEINIELLRELAAAAPTLAAAIERADGVAPAVRRRLRELVEDLPGVTKDVKQSALHLSGLIESMRELVRGRNQTSTASDPIPVVRHAMTVCQHLVLTKRASIGYDGPTALPLVRMSVVELTQVLINVVSNAAQAVIARSAPQGRISIRAREDQASAMLELQVHDDGVGIAPDVLQRIGTPFFTTRVDGTGLGFAQCQRLVGTAGGRIQIESEVGIGTTVTIHLPIAA